MNSKNNSKKSKRKSGFLYNFCYDFVRLSGAIPMLLILRTKVHRPYGTKSPKGKVLISANHRSFLDPVIVHSAIPSRRIHSLATKNLFNTKLKNAFFNKMHCIVVDKENFSLSSLHEVISRLQEEKAVVIFPEGSINREKEDAIRTFKSGAVLMAHRADAPILPLYIVKHEKWWQRHHVVMGEPFNVREFVGNMPTLEQLNEASAALRKKELELQKYFEELPIYQKISSKSIQQIKSINESDIKYEQTV